MENLYLYRNRNRTAAMQLMTLILKWSSCDYFASHYRFAMSFDFIWLQLPVHSSRLVSFRFRFVSFSIYLFIQYFIAQPSCCLCCCWFYRRCWSVLACDQLSSHLKSKSRFFCLTSPIMCLHPALAAAQFRPGPWCALRPTAGIVVCLPPFCCLCDLFKPKLVFV